MTGVQTCALPICAPGTAGVGGIVNSQKPQSGNVAGQGSGNEKPTQAAGTAGGSGSGSALALGQFTNRQAVMYHLGLHLFRVQRVLRLQSVVFIVAKHHTLYLHKLNKKDKDKDKHHHHVNNQPRLFYHLLVPLVTTTAVDSVAHKQPLLYQVPLRQ